MRPKESPNVAALRSQLDRLTAFLAGQPGDGVQALAGSGMPQPQPHPGQDRQPRPVPLAQLVDTEPVVAAVLRAVGQHRAVRPDRGCHPPVGRHGVTRGMRGRDDGQRHPHGGDDPRAAALASVSGFKLFVTTTPDDLLARAIDAAPHNPAPRIALVRYEDGEVSYVLAPQRLGVGPAELQAINPRLIYCALTGYGDRGPLKDRAGYDQVLQSFPDGNKAAAAELKKGLALVELGQQEAGIAALRHVVQRYPKSNEAMQARDRLRKLGVATTGTEARRPQ